MRTPAEEWSEAQATEQRPSSAETEPSRHIRTPYTHAILSKAGPRVLALARAGLPRRMNPVDVCDDCGHDGHRSRRSTLCLTSAEEALLASKETPLASQADAQEAILRSQKEQTTRCPVCASEVEPRSFPGSCYACDTELQQVKGEPFTLDCEVCAGAGTVDHWPCRVCLRRQVRVGLEVSFDDE